MGDRLWAGKPSWYRYGQGVQLSAYRDGLPASRRSPMVNSAWPTLVGWHNEYVTYELQGEGLLWLIWAVVCLPPAPRVQLFAGTYSMHEFIGFSVFLLFVCCSFPFGIFYRPRPTVVCCLMVNKDVFIYQLHALLRLSSADYDSCNQHM